MAHAVRACVCACLCLCVSVCFPQLNTRVEFELFVLIAQIVHFVALTNTFHTASIHSTVHSHCQRECAKEGDRSLSCSIAATFSVIVSTSCRQSARIFRLCVCVHENSLVFLLRCCCCCRRSRCSRLRFYYKTDGSRTR